MNHDEQQQRVSLAPNLAALDASDHDWDCFAQVRSLKELETKTGKPYMVIEIADLHAVIESKIWDSSQQAMAAARAAEVGQIVKLRGKVKMWNNQPQLVIDRFKVLEEGEAPEGFDPAQLIDPSLANVEDLICRTLVFDIETVPALDVRELPATVASALSDNAARKEMDTDAVMGMSPFFGKVVSLAIGDGDAEPGSEDDQVTVLAVPPDGVEVEDCPPWLRLMSEADLLRAFWALASKAECVVSYNGRGFDVPFVVARSLIHEIPARVDLVSNRWSLRPHLDLFELVTQRGRGPSKLDVVCWALGIESPKEVMDGSMVAPAYERGEIVKIADYNAHDVRATRSVYRKCRDNILRYRADWAQGRK